MSMHPGRNLVLGVLLTTVILGAGCKKKKPKLPAQSLPPVIEQPTIAPVATQPSPTPPTVSPDEQPPATTTPATSSSKKGRSHRKKTPPVTAAKPATPKPEPEKPAETSSNVTISAEVPAGAASQRRQQAEGLLQGAESNLKRINHTLSDGEESMLRQVRNFITQSRLAMQDGDFERAYNLATKANLLSQELVK